MFGSEVDVAAYVLVVGRMAPRGARLAVVGLA